MVASSIAWRSGNQQQLRLAAVKVKKEQAFSSAVVAFLPDIQDGVVSKTLWLCPFGLHLVAPYMVSFLRAPLSPDGS